MSVVKSDLIKELADSYPNFLRKDLLRLVDITLYEMQDALRRGERVELRDVFTIEPRLQRARVSRNPKTIALTPNAIITPILENFLPLINLLIFSCFNTVKLKIVKIIPIIHM